jgi:hypothetical protein
VSSRRAAAEVAGDQRPERRATIVELPFDDELLLVDLTTARQHRLNLTAAAIWVAADGTRTAAEIADHVASAFGTSAATIAAAVRATLEELACSFAFEPATQPPTTAAPLPCNGCGDRPLAPTPPDPMADRDPAALWTHTLGPYRAGADRFGIRLDDSDLAAWLTTTLEPLSDGGPETDVTDDLTWYSIVPAADDAGLVHVDASGAPLITAARQRARTILLGDITQRAVASVHGLPIHAAGVASGGRAVLLPGRSGAGKSTLVAALVQRGLHYLGDELVAVDPTNGRVIAHPKAIALRPDSVELLGLDAATLPSPDEGTQTHVDPAVLDGATAKEAELVAIVFPERGDVESPQLQPMEPIDTASRLIRDLFRRRLDEDAVRALASLANVVPAYELTYAVALDVHPLIEALVRQPAEP